MTNIDNKIAELAKKRIVLFNAFKEVEEQIQALKDRKTEMLLAEARRNEEIDKMVSFISGKVQFYYSEDVEKDSFVVEGRITYNEKLFKREYPISLSKLGSFRIPAMKARVVQKIAEDIVDNK
jgi:hypothetical protein|nr:MAG TPA: hypothetical protein [Crassvirales sp.]